MKYLEKSSMKQRKTHINKGNLSDTSQTGWGNVATWYDGHLKDDNTYHAKVIVPNITRLVALKSTESLLELGCGQGFVLEKFLPFSVKLTGVDIGAELIDIAKRNNPKISYLAASADDKTILTGKRFDAIMIVLALQNMKNLQAVAENVDRLLEKNGRIYLVLNHPAFRIPQHSDWLFDEKKGVQARRVDRYMSEIEIAIDMTPGKKTDKEMTKSFHRPMQVYSKVFAKHGFAITKIEEWISHKESQKGPRAEAENAARKEFPMFMCLELKRV
jgi:SAM-dependent methyltransferase